jgi:translocation and assembly module TamB
VANPAAPKVAAAPAARSATPEPTTSAGLRAASIEVDAQGDAVAARLNWDSERAGQVQGEVRSRIAREGGGWVWPADAPLAGSVRARMPRIGIWSVLAPPGWRVQGTLDADIAIAGTRAAPQWSGTLKADDLGVRSVVDGIELRDGRLRATLRGTRLDIEEFRIAGARGGSNRIAGYSGSRTNESGTDGGLLTAQGNVAWEPVPAGGGSGMRMDIQAQARALRLSARSDRQLTVSGDLRTRLENGRLVVRGALRTDRAVIILPDESTPSLGSDVVVRSAAKDREAAEKAARAAAREEKAERAAASPAPQTAKPPDILVSFDLGDDFAVQGYGLTTQLTGKVDVRSDRGLAAGPQVTGEIRTARGRYRAYGQQLDIETGIIRFIGPYDNPTLEILALRPNITVRAGVRITGTALSPQVRLYSEPVMTDAETLSWVVLGRSTANGGAEAALLQQAALAFLSGSGSGPTGGFASKLGLDEVGFKGPGSGEDAASAALTFGKRISRNLYVTYERSLSGTLGTLYIFYDLTRRFTLRGQAGVKSGLDLIYTLPYD